MKSVVSLATMCQFLCFMAVSCLAMYEKGVIMGRILVSVCGFCWDSRQLWLFFMFLMMTCSGYVWASRMRVRLLSSDFKIWSSERSCCNKVLGNRLYLLCS